MSNIAQPDVFINYISEFKKIFVTRQNKPVSIKFKIDNRIDDTYYFQQINANNQIVDLSGFNYQFLGSYIDARQTQHVLFFSDDFTITNNVLSFKVNTYTTEYVNYVKVPKQIDITIRKKATNLEQVILRDTGFAYPTPVYEGEGPGPVVAGFGLQKNGFVMSLTGTVLSGDNSTIAINDNVISYIGEAGNTYTAGEGIGISDQNVISLTATIPTTVAQLTDASNYATTAWVEGKNYLTAVPDTYALKTDIPTNVSDLTNDVGYLSSLVINIDGTDEDQMTSLNLDNNFYIYQGMIGVDATNIYQSMYDSGLFVDYALTSQIPLSTSQLVNDSDFITSSALTGISTDKLQKIVIDETTQDSGFIMQYDPTADVVYNTITTDDGLLILNVVSGFENDIEVGKAATFENWVKVQGALTGVAVGQGLNLIGELPEEFNSNNTQVFSRRIARINRDVTVQQISYNYDFYEAPVLLTLRSNGSTTVTLSAVGSPDSVTLSSRVNDNAWTAYSVGDSITLSDGDEVSFKGTNDHFSKTSNDRYTFVVTGDGTIKVFGSIKSLIGEDSTMNNYCFNKLFHSCAKLTDASKLVLPKTGLSNYCFRNMFYGCTSLTAAPEVNALQIPEGACSFMYSGCTTLSSVPDLHAEIMGKSACQNMFAYDTALVKAPAIPATILSGQDVCKEMFRNCSSLTSVPDLSATTVSDSCFNQMFRGCSSLSTAPSLPAITLVGGCYRQMFEQCSSLIEAPNLPAVDLASYCYYEMFKNCSSLSSISVKFTSWGTNSQTTNWVNGVAANGIITKPYELSEETGSSRIPNGWTVEIDDYSKAPITFVAVDDSVSLEFHNDSDPQTVSLDYNKNNTGWTTVTVNDPISLDAGDKIAFRGYNNSGFNNGSDSPYKFTASGDGKLKVYGNTMSLLDSSDFATKTVFDFLINPTYIFQSLFQGMSSLVDASKLLLPATQLGDYGCSFCYNNMFYGCTSLTAVPQLPSESVSTGGYQCMFYGCTSLSTAPQLPATNLGTECYSQMFQSCTSLTASPQLPSIIVSQYCYSSMFYECTSLVSAGTIRAGSLDGGSCDQMFYGCTSLSSISVNFSEWGYSSNWVYDVAANGTFYKPAALTESFGVDYIPQGWTVVNR